MLHHAPTPFAVRSRTPALRTLACVCCGWLLALSAARALDLSRAVIVAPRDLSRPERKAVTMLVEEIEKRTQLRLEVRDVWPAKTEPLTVVAIGAAAAVQSFAGPYADRWPADGTALPAEGFRIRTESGGGSPAVFVVGNDARGVSFGIGHLLRQLELTRGRVTLRDEYSIRTAPRYPLRGHQLGYRPKTHSYDAWDRTIWEQY